MRYWLTRDDMRLHKSTVKRFEASHWTVNFPRGAMASVVSEPSQNRLKVHATFGRKCDLVGLVYSSEEDDIHIGHRRHVVRDYRRCTLRFRWRSSGIMPLDSANGPTLTIEGRDEGGNPRSWYVRLWNYAEGAATDAIITLPFDDLRAGFAISQETEVIDVRSIDRLFISLIPPDYDPLAQERFANPHPGWVEIGEIQSTGSGSVIGINDCFVPEHDVRICTAYDDCYHLSPERVIDGIERLGYRDRVNHYVGMSHYPALGGDGLVRPDIPMNEPARRWHESFASLAAQRGFDVIWSVSMELLDQYCPEHWKQRAWDGASAQTGYSPPSTLLSPASDPAVDYLTAVSAAFVDLGVAAGLRPFLQIGEPWWWVNADNAICIYDASAVGHWPSGHERIRDVRTVTAEQGAVLVDAGAKLAGATTRIVQAVRTVHNSLVSHLLIYLPSILKSHIPHLRDVNLPLGWQSPAFDVLQLEDYEWVTAGLRRTRLERLTACLTRLDYRADASHYLSGFVPDTSKVREWSKIVRAISDARDLGFAETFIWAQPQIFRDGVTIFEGDQEVQGFQDVMFPLALGSRASVEARFSTTIVDNGVGLEARNVNFAQARTRFDVGPSVRSLEDLQDLLHFFREMRGNAISFRFRDDTDFSSREMTSAPTPGDVLLGIGDGEQCRFDLVKRYGAGEVRRITRPVAPSVLVSLNNLPSVDWILDEGGVIEFATPPEDGVEVRAGFLFDVPVRFEEATLKISRNTYLAGEIATVPLIEVREA